MTETTPFLSVAEQMSDAVDAADFPMLRLVFRNQRAAGSVGMADLSADAWIDHFGRFRPLPGNLPRPLAMRYHGHQFGSYNPDLGDGRGFLFAQLRDDDGRWLDLGTKGSGRTPWSRRGDGRLTLKGGVREILAASYLEALGVNTSKAFSLIETGEKLMRGDEPSPTRSSVLVRLSHSHIRFGSFQRLAALGEADTMAALIGYCVQHFHPGAARPTLAETAAALLADIARATAAMIAGWMAAGFVHGVMNTDNFNITGETFDFGPWRFLPVSDPNFTAAYFDETGLYRFGRQPAQGLWSLQQLAGAMTLVTGEETAGLVTALEGYEPAYRRALAAAMTGRLGIAQAGDVEDDIGLVAELFAWMTETGIGWQGVFHDWFCGRESEGRAMAGPRAALYERGDFAPVRERLMARTPVRPERLASPVFTQAEPEDMLIEDVEAIWAPIAQGDDWTLFRDKLARIETLRTALDLSPPRA